MAPRVSRQSILQGAAYLRGRRCSCAINDLLHSADGAGFKADLDAVWMMGGTGQNIFHDSARSLSSALILFLDDVDLKSGLYVFSVLTIHSLPPLRISWAVGSG